MNRFFILFFCLFIGVNPCFAENEKPKYGIGWGVFTCYEFIHPKAGEDYVERDYMFFAWAQGYMSAKNMYSKTNIPLKYDPNEQLVIMKTYCEEHKRNPVAYAVEYLYNELSDKVDK
jgi:hypothetical protein